jgi:hypothetical protein
MRWLGRVIGLAVVGGCIVLSGCTRTTPEPPSLPSRSAARSVFTDTALYRRYCVVPEGKSVDLKQPCFLLDQGRQPNRLPPGLRP